ncbi:MAG: hypothetical protein B7Y26_07935 [Hydrogenophilales bacterium 16-64-46]|nr:MAG: hypothetical protein B7Z32_08475 [Hydrogenophilales bacterium 12-64-13]OYZ05671.1 MAG: hypothetical protein B7Y26_07935 [Hydrogenophilales bacterium 16-64-46]OZA40249.1 MAG: hypothetical protein B7X87_01315 [Hydrogenophilales bacterium 17-64-34]HQT00800.1 hypothetical protein [Thiobacillus sp.]
MKPRCLILLACLALPASASSPAEIEYRVQQTLTSSGTLFVDFDVDEDGRAHVLFGSNEPAWRVEKAVKALQSQPGIPGLVWTQLDTELCPVR